MIRKLFTAFLITGSIACNSPSTDKPSTTTAESANPDGIVIKKSFPGEVDTIMKSLKAYESNNINGVRCIIQYHSPAVRNRIIWGGLVPFDKPWVTGAHMATSLEISSEFTIEGTKIPAGKYALFTIPSRGEWTFIINKNWQQHLTDEYNPSEDLLRLAIKPDTLSYIQERLRFEIDQTGEYKAKIVFSWEKLNWSIPVKLKRG